MRSRLWHGKSAMTDWAVSEYLVTESGQPIKRVHAARTCHAGRSRGRTAQARAFTCAAARLRSRRPSRSTLYQRYPGLAIYRVSYRNLTAEPLTVSGWSNAALQLPGHDQAALPGPQFWSYCGSTHPDRRDWVQPVAHGFAQDNFMGMNASDYGGGTPVVDVWRRDWGVAIGHLDPLPQEVYLPGDAHARGGVERRAQLPRRDRHPTRAETLPTA